MFEEVKEKIKELDGIISCKITGDSEIDEIHIIADKRRQPKRIVRDVETIVLVNTDKEINHKKISIAQVNSESGESNSRKVKLISIYQEHNKPIIHIQLSVNGDSISKKIEGSFEQPISKIVAEGMAEMIMDYTNFPGRIRVENVFKTGINNEILIVKLILFNGGYSEEKLVGAVYINDNLPLAAGKACLKALNRKINGWE
ncbi:MAG: hypothetical protein ACOCQS_02285 [Bacillota bacterium]